MKTVPSYRKKRPHIPSWPSRSCSSARSYGSISYNAHESLARAATELGVCATTPARAACMRIFYRYGPNTIVQVASAGSAYTANT